MGFVLVDNTSYDVTGVYYGGINEKYCDIFNITIKKYAKAFNSLETAQKIAERLNRAGYAFEVVPTERGGAKGDC